MCHLKGFSTRVCVCAILNLWSQSMNNFAPFITARSTRSFVSHGLLRNCNPYLWLSQLRTRASAVASDSKPFLNTSNTFPTPSGCVSGETVHFITESACHTYLEDTAPGQIRMMEFEVRGGQGGVVWFYDKSLYNMFYSRGKSHFSWTKVEANRLKILRPQYRKLRFSTRYPAQTEEKLVAFY